jgi:hypothetical protein
MTLRVVVEVPELICKRTARQGATMFPFRLVVWDENAASE